jgi:hypothetical protein
LAPFGAKVVINLQAAIDVVLILMKNPVHLLSFRYAAFVMDCAMCDHSKDLHEKLGSKDRSKRHGYNYTFMTMKLKILLVSSITKKEETMRR